MSLSLKNKTILITGSTDGLGKLLAIDLAKLGANIIVHGRSETKVAEVIAELSAVHDHGQHQGISCDLSQPNNITDAFKEVKQLDVLVNNAGVWLEGSTTEASEEKILELVNVNLAAPLVLTKMLLPLLSKSKFGQVLNVSSIAGVEIPVNYFHTIYSATKFGLQAFSEALAKEYDNTNVRIMGYYPGGMETKLFQKAGNEYKSHEPWMFDPQESVEAMVFMLTRDPKINVKRMDLINHLQK